MIGGWDLVEDKVFAEAATSYTFSGLAGNTAEEYRIIVKLVNGYNGAINLLARPNNDSGSNYGREVFYGSGATKAAYRATNLTGLLLSGNNANEISFVDFMFHAKSGQVRTALSKIAQQIATTTVGVTAWQGMTWNNTSDEVTSIVVTGDQANTIGAGSRIILMKKRTTAGGCWKLIFNQTLTGAASSVTIPSLDGDTDVIYSLECRLINAYNGGNFFAVRPNNDTGANYGFQYLSAYSGNNIGAAGSTSESTIYLGSGAALGSIDHARALIFAKTGTIRPAIVEQARSIVTTTPAEIDLFGYSHNDANNNYTSLVVYCQRTNGLATGTDIELWAYTPPVANTKSFTDDAFAISDNIRRAGTRPILDIATITDTVKKASPRQFSDTMNVSEPSFTKKPAKFFLETFTISDMIRRAITRTWAETVTLVEVAVRNIRLAIMDTITTTDTLVRGMTRVLTDTVDLSDWVTSAKKWLRETHITSAWNRTGKTVSSWAKSVKSGGIWTILKR